MRRNISDVVLSGADQKRIKKLVEDVGERAAADALCLNRQTLARAAAGFPLHRGTCALIEAKLQETWLRQAAE